MSKPFTCKLAKVNNSNDYYVHNYIYDFGDDDFYPCNYNCYYLDYKSYDRYCGGGDYFYHKSNHHNCCYSSNNHIYNDVYNHNQRNSNNTYIFPLFSMDTIFYVFYFI